MIYLFLGSRLKNLAIKENVLDTNMGYTFKLSVSADNFGDQWGYALMRLPPNQPPKNGNCSIKPQKVEALIEEINISCDYWEDEDGRPNDQLIYNFYVERIDKSSDWYPLYKGPQRQGSFTLAPWPGSNMVMVKLCVEDRQGGRTEAATE